MKARRSASTMYETMRDAIAYLRARAGEKPAVAEVARAAGMSASRFEHAFKEWVGLPPKRFLSYLAKERAKILLKASDGVFRAASASGLSGPGRLHDLLVAHEAASPGEIRRGDIDIVYGFYPSPFGPCLIGATRRGICVLSFIDEERDGPAVAKIRETWPRARLSKDSKRVSRIAKQIFGARRGNKRIPLVLKGTNFQVKVWEALLAIPEGQAVRYADVARAIGSPKAIRAVGSACGRNPIAFLIPCHRVLASDGGLGGYNGGLPRKEAMLAWETARTAGRKEA